MTMDIFTISSVFPLSWLITRFLTWVTYWLLLVDRGLLTLWNHRSSSLVSCEVRVVHIVQCITYLHVFSSVLLCPVRFSRKDDARFISTPIPFFLVVFCRPLFVMLSSFLSCFLFFLWYAYTKKKVKHPLIY